MAFVVLRDGATATADELLERCRAPAGQVQGAEGRHLHRCPAPQPVGQGPQARAANRPHEETDSERLEDDRLLLRRGPRRRPVRRTTTTCGRSARSCRSTHLGVVAVTGYDEALEVYRDTDSFSSCNSVIGPFATFPVPLEGDDVSDIVAAHRDAAPDGRAHGHHGPARPHPRAGAAHAADHAEAPQGQRGLHVAPRRPPARRARRPPVAASSSPPTRSPSPCSWSPTSSACPRRTTSGSASSSA